MGSFNTTCFASQQTISEHEASRVIFLLQQRTFTPVEMLYRDKPESAYGFANSTCYTDCFWKPEGLFLEATYADYGQFELKRTPHTRSALASLLGEFLRRGLTVLPGENTSHDVAVDIAGLIATLSPAFQAAVNPKNFNATSAVFNSEELDAEFDKVWGHLWTAVQENRLFMKDYSGVTRPMAVAVLCEPAYQALVTSVASQTTYDGEKMDMASLLARTIIEGAERIAEFKAEDGFRASWLMRESLREMLSRVAQSMRHNSSYVTDFIDAALKEDGTIAGLAERLLPGIRPVLQDAYAIGGLDNFNLRFSPMVYCGQDYSNEIGRGYAAFVKEVSVKVSRVSLESSYGSFEGYQFKVLEDFDSEALSRACREHDFALNVLSKEPVAGGILVTVEATMADLSDLLEFMPDLAKKIWFAVTVSKI